MASGVFPLVRGVIEYCDHIRWYEEYLQEVGTPIGMRPTSKQRCLASNLTSVTWNWRYLMLHWSCLSSIQRYLTSRGLLPPIRGVLPPIGGLTSSQSFSHLQLNICHWQLKVSHLQWGLSPAVRGLSPPIIGVSPPIRDVLVQLEISYL